MQARWAGGYAAELPYIPTYLQAQAPAEMALVAAVAGVREELPREGLTLLDLGCGRGISVLAFAAANPSWTCIGLDAMPAHVAEARSIAAEAGLDNARFIEADLAALDEAAAARLLPEADVVTLHGVWSWVADPVRAGILRVIQARLRPGGMALVTYNALPGWSRDLAAQRLIHALVERGSGPPEQRMAAALAVAQRMQAAGAAALQDSRLLERAATVPEAARGAYLRYMVHEVMTAHWRPAWPQDVAAAFAEAKLDPIGPALLGFRLPELLLDAEQRASIEALPGDISGEFLRDLFLPPTLRLDLFVRGALPAEVLPALRGTLLALRRLPPDGVVTWHLPGRVAELPAAVTRIALDALAAAPCSIAALCALPGMQDVTPGELLMVLVGSGVAAPVWRRDSDPALRARAHRFNRVILRRLGADVLAAGGQLPAAAPMLGAGLPLSPVELATLLALHDAASAGLPAPDPAAIAPDILAADPSAAALATTTQQVAAALAERAPAWRTLGLV